VVVHWEAELRTLASRRPDVRVPVVRTGIVLSRHGGALAKMLPLFRAGVAGRLGDGSQWMSWIHIDDIARLFLHALDSTATGPLEGTAPQPVTNRTFTKALCAALDVFENAPVPSLAIHALYGEMGSLVLGSTRVEPLRAAAAGFEWKFATIDDACADLLSPLRGNVREKRCEQWVPHAPADVWPFFCDEKNLEALTPEFLNFRVIGKSTPEIGDGTLIDYRLTLERIPLTWQSRIEAWEPPCRFVDTQVKGPYAQWHHTHEFVPLGGGTLLRDIVAWRPPLGWLGSAAAGGKIESYVDRIFAYRATRIAERFGG
jgi:ligand-binding SRPBCC domain-containing protein